MIEKDTPAERERTADSAASNGHHELSVTPSRRRLLETLTSGGALLLAGCGQDSATDTSTPIGTANKRRDSPSRMLTQTFRVPVNQNPNRASFYQFAPDSAFAVTPKERFSGRLKWIIREPGVWVDKRYVGGNIQYTWLEDITVSPTEITVSIRDDATWSDGHPITGTDIAIDHMENYLRNQFPPYFATEEKEEPTVFWDAIDEFDIRDKSVTYRSSPGYFKKWWDVSLRRIFGVGRHSGGTTAPTHVEPYDTYAEVLFETARRAQLGEINPWKGWNDPSIQPDDPHRDSLTRKHLGKEGKYVSKFSDPEHVLSTSAWDLVELNGPEAVYEPNPHHRNTETVNFDRLILEYTASGERSRAALSADRLDYASPGPTPQAVVESLPDTISQLQIPGRSGNEIGLNFNHPALGKRKVRLALMYALDKLTIANNIHQSAALPVRTPGGDSWDATDYVSEEWIEENLTTYHQDRAKAAAFMRAAGYTKDGKQWINADGKPLTLLLPTSSETPRWEPTVASQLTEFGIQTSVKTLTGSTFDSRVSEGEFPMWTASGTATSNAVRTLLFWVHVPTYPERYGIYPEDQFERGEFSINGVAVPRTEERYKTFTIEAPPIGQPNGPLQEYHPSALSLFYLTNPPEPEFRRRVKTAMWLANWFLPTIPINKTLKQHFIDDTHWQWPTGTLAWQTFTGGGPTSSMDIFTSGTLRANPDNPEKEAKQ